MSEARRKPFLLTPQLQLFMLAMTLANIGGNMYGPLLPLYLKSLNANVVQIGLFFTLLQIFPLVLQIIGGWISDNLGRLRSIAMGSIAGALSYVALILAPTWQWLLLGEGLNAVTRSLIGPSYGAFIAEQSAEEHRSRVFAITETLFTVVTIVGPPLGGWLADTYGFKPMLIVAGCFYLVAAVIRVRMARHASRGAEAHPRALSVSDLKSNLGAMVALLTAGGLLTWIFLTDGVRDVAFSMSFQLMPLYLEDFGALSIQQIGWLQSIFGICNMAMTIPAGALADKTSERLAIAAGFAVQFVALLVFLYAGSFWGFAASWALFGIGVALMAPAYQALISKAVPDHLRGTAFGVLRSSLGVFSLPAPAIGAQLWERVSPRFPFQITAGAVLLSVIPVWLKFKLPPAEVKSEDSQATDRDSDSVPTAHDS